ncbi:hypothetical protein I6J22_06195 [Corynebacterium kroppenstedtii]|uniref:hypothetical protein n=1 Tax=Corynebacterium kroppenstedtii TaxID=161879 RepID=UPI001950CA22|nr:hypothetical protein [Corynebacterium kroppenstedtii]QRP09847.1 hypothetical protein I6J22_06195 [Corynebacterium kroppenstedtii]
MTTWKASSGTSFTDEDLEKWARIQESDEPFTGGHLGSSRPGSLVSIGNQTFPDSYLP